jgi:hypothetical protein
LRIGFEGRSLALLIGLFAPFSDQLVDCGHIPASFSSSDPATLAADHVTSGSPPPLRYKPPPRCLARAAPKCEAGEAVNTLGGDDASSINGCRAFYRQTANSRFSTWGCQAEPAPTKRRSLTDDSCISRAES